MSLKLFYLLQALLLIAKALPTFQGMNFQQGTFSPTSFNSFLGGGGGGGGTVPQSSEGLSQASLNFGSLGGGESTLTRPPASDEATTVSQTTVQDQPPISTIAIPSTDSASVASPSTDTASTASTTSLTTNDSAASAPSNSTDSAASAPSNSTDSAASVPSNSTDSAASAPLNSTDSGATTTSSQIATDTAATR